MMRFIQRLRMQRRDRNRTCWIWCPRCRHDLNGDGYSFASHGMGEDLAYYECAACGFKSKFDLEPPAPIYLGPWQSQNDSGATR